MKISIHISLMQFGILIMTCSAVLGQDDVDPEQRQFASPQDAQPSPAGTERKFTELPRLFQKFAGQQPAAIIDSLQRIQQEPGVVAATVVVINRVAIGQDMVRIDLFDASVVCLKTRQRKLDPAGKRRMWEFLVARESDVASLRYDARTGLRGTFVLGSRRWELAPMPASEFALISFASSAPADRDRRDAGWVSESTALPPIVERSQAARDRAVAYVSTLSRLNVGTVDGFARTETPFSADSAGFVQTLPGIGDVLIRRATSAPVGSAGAFQWNGFLFAGPVNSGSLVATPVGCSGTFSLQRRSYEVRPLSGDLHVLLQLDTTRFPNDESEDDQNSEP